MGGSQSKYGCCMSDKKMSVMEISVYDSFVKGSSYESPIPDEVCEFEISNRVMTEGVIDDWSTDIEKVVDVDPEPRKNVLQVSRIALGSKNLTKWDKNK